MKTAIVSLAYDRIDSLRRQVQSLEQAYYPEPATLIFSIDKGPTTELEQWAAAYQWPHGEKRVITHTSNLGTRNHILSLGQLFDCFDALIVLEDDITVAPSFYLYAKACAAKYKDDSRIAGVSLYGFALNYQNDLPFEPVSMPYDVYFMNCAQSWGEVWLKSQWLEFKAWYDNHWEPFNLPHLPREINSWPDKSWLKYHTRYCMEHDRYFVFPYHSMSTNNGDAGENTERVESLHQVGLMTGRMDSFRLPMLDEVTMAYDGFFEPKSRDPLFGLPPEECSFDLYGEKPTCVFRRYVFSTRCLPYRQMRSFSTELRPLVANVLAERHGQGIWLYDTSQVAPPPRPIDRYTLFYHYYQKGLFKARTMIGPRRLISLVVEIIKNKTQHRRKR
ncbi:MAG: hypothetical protein I3J02_10430 [Prevotella sp.]|nr:hypothetical protein [Prevotella sp.]